MRIIKLFTGLILLITIFSSVALPNTIYVPGDSLTIQSAVNGALSGDTIIVMPGSYNERIIIAQKSLVLMANDTTAGNIPVISAVADKRAITIVDAPDTVKIIGFEITGGESQNDTLYNSGGGILVWNSPAIIKNCNIHDNSATGGFGGGINFRAGSYAEIRNCQIHHNQAQWGGGIMASSGSTGGLIEFCIVYENSSEMDGGGIYLYNLEQISSDFLLINNTVSNNQGGFGGLGLHAVRVDVDGYQNIFAQNMVSDTSQAVNSYEVAFDSCNVNSYYWSCNDVFSPCCGRYWGVDDFTGDNYNFSQDPFYCDTSSDDYSLNDVSECAPPYSPCGGLVGALDVNCNYTNRIWYVNDDNTAGPWDGTVAFPFQTVQDGIDNSHNGDTVLVDNGLYDEVIYLNGKSILLTSNYLYSSDTLDIINTILGSDWFKSVVIENGEDTSTIINGFKIISMDTGVCINGSSPKISNLFITCPVGISCIGGYPPPLTEPIISGCHLTHCGLGIRVYNSVVKVDSTYIIGNSRSTIGIKLEKSEAEYTGINLTNSTLMHHDTAFYNTSGYIGPTSAISNDCLFENNNIAFWGHCSTTNSIISNCDYGFASNYGPQPPSRCIIDSCLIETISIGIVHYLTTCSITNSIFRYNTGRTIETNQDGPKGDKQYGAVYIDNCEFYENDSLYVTAYFGGIIDIMNCLFRDNNAELIISEGGVYRATIENCTFYNNSPGAIYHNGFAIFNIFNSVIAYNNGYGIHYNEFYWELDSSRVTTSCNDVFENSGGNYVGMTDQTGLNGNISENPIFCDTTNDDFYVHKCSPCAPDNNSCNLLIGAFDTGCGYCGPVWYVDADNISGPWDGSPEYPFQYIQDGINASQSGDTVLVLPGSYSGNGNRNITIGGKRLLVASIGGTSVTSITLDSLDNGFILNELDSDTSLVIAGFTINGGKYGVFMDRSHPKLTNLIISGSDSAGIYLYGPIGYPNHINISNCTTYCDKGVEIQGEYGAGDFLGTITNSSFIGDSRLSSGVIINATGSIIIDGCEFNSHNIAFQGSFGQPSWQHIINNCVLDNNEIAIYGDAIVLNSEIINCGIGGQGAYGSPSYQSFENTMFSNITDTVFSHFSSLSIVGCSVINNSGIIQGNPGYEDAEIVFDSCVIRGNLKFGLLTIPIGLIEIKNCLYDSNYAPIEIYNTIAKNITNCTVTRNEGGGIYFASSTNTPNINNSIIAFNYGVGIVDGSTLGPNINCCDLFGNDSGDYSGINNPIGINNNFSEDPLFCFIDTANFYLYDISPCAPDNNPCSTLIGVFGVGCDNYIDTDGDGIPDNSDNCPNTFNPNQADTDIDQVGDSCDNCILATNPNQEDVDADSVGDSCDNCPDLYNPNQEDIDENEVGDLCQEGYTPPGSDVEVPVTDSLTIIFEHIIEPGFTEITTSTAGPSPPTGFKLVPSAPPVYYEVTTTAVFSGNIILCFTYDENEVHGPESNLRIFHREGDPLKWEDATLLPVNELDNQICGEVDSLSPFILADFTCGDANSDFAVNIFDITYLISYLYKGGPAPYPMESADVNGDGNVNIFDITYLISYLYKGGPEPDCI